MARAQQRPRRRLLGFAILIVLVITGGVILASQGDLISPIQSTTMLISMSSNEDGFAMVGERPSLPDIEGYMIDRNGMATMTTRFRNYLGV